ISKIVMNRINQFLPGKSMNPGLVWAAAGADFRNDHQMVGIGIKRLLDNLIRDMRTIEIARIDVVHSGFDSCPQNTDGTIRIAGWSPNLGTRQLHRTISHTVYGHRRVCKGVASPEVDVSCHCASLELFLISK